MDPKVPNEYDRGRLPAQNHDRDHDTDDGSRHDGSQASGLHHHQRTTSPHALKLKEKYPSDFSFPLTPPPSSFSFKPWAKKKGGSSVASSAGSDQDLFGTVDSGISSCVWRQPAGSLGEHVLRKMCDDPRYAVEAREVLILINSRGLGYRAAMQRLLVKINAQGSWSDVVTPAHFRGEEDAELGIDQIGLSTEERRAAWQKMFEEAEAKKRTHGDPDLHLKITDILPNQDYGPDTLQTHLVAPSEIDTLSHFPKINPALLPHGADPASGGGKHPPESDAAIKLEADQDATPSSVSKLGFVTPPEGAVNFVDDSGCVPDGSSTGDTHELHAEQTQGIAIDANCAAAVILRDLSEHPTDGPRARELLQMLLRGDPRFPRAVLEFMGSRSGWSSEAPSAEWIDADADAATDISNTDVPAGALATLR